MFLHMVCMRQLSRHCFQFLLRYSSMCRQQVSSSVHFCLMFCRPTGIVHGMLCQSLGMLGHRRNPAHNQYFKICVAFEQNGSQIVHVLGGTLLKHSFRTIYHLSLIRLALTIHGTIQHHGLGKALGCFLYPFLVSIDRDSTNKLHKLRNQCSTHLVLLSWFLAAVGAIILQPTPPSVVIPCRSTGELQEWMREGRACHAGALLSPVVWHALYTAEFKQSRFT